MVTKTDKLDHKRQNPINPGDWKHYRHIRTIVITSTKIQIFSNTKSCLKNNAYHRKTKVANIAKYM